MTDPVSPPLASRILRGVVLSLFGVFGAILSFGIIFWDADFYAARDKYEHLKAALFGEWQARDADTQEFKADLEAALNAASDFTFFRSEPISGSNLTVQTGLRFATARDVVTGRASEQWCYISLPLGEISKQIELGTQSADEPPVYADLILLNTDAVSGSGLSAPALMQLAQTHCRFE